MTDVPSSPIGDVNTVDIVGVRKDGGLDMVISAIAPLDDSPATLVQVETKIRNYMKGAKSAAFLGQYGRSVGVPVTIYISCAHSVAPGVHDLVEKLRTEAATAGIAVELRSHMGDLQ